MLVHAVLVALALVVAAGSGGCGGPAASGAADPEPPSRHVALGTVAAEPIEVAVTANRTGEALRLDIEATARGTYEGHPFEDPERWQISAHQAARELDRLVNGSVHVEREPAGRRQWDTVVRFSVAYRVDPAAGRVVVRITPPGEPTVERSFAP
jgi:hypothetical protein